MENIDKNATTTVNLNHYLELVELSNKFISEDNFVVETYYSDYQSGVNSFYIRSIDELVEKLTKEIEQLRRDKRVIREENNLLISERNELYLKSKKRPWFKF